MKKFKKLSIIIPVYNEEKTIKQVIKEVKKSKTLGLKKEIVIIDDGSNKATKSILKKYKNEKNIILLNNKKNKGKGYCIKRGFKQSTGDIVLIQDADLEYSPKEYPELISPILQNKADAVIGSRFMTQKAHRTLYFHHYLFNKMLTFFSNILTNLNLSDMECGYKVFKGEFARKIVPKLKSNSFTIEPELIAKVAKNNLSVYEVGVSYRGRTYAEGKKITWVDGIKAFFGIIYFNLLA